MRILSKFRCLLKRSEDTTNESASTCTASTWHRNLRLMACSPGSTSLTNATSKKQKQKKEQQGMLDAHRQLQTGNNETDSGLNMFQTLMRNSIAPSRTSNGGVNNSAKPAAKDAAAAAVELVSANNCSCTGKTKSFKNDPKSNPVAKSGTQALTASSAVLEKPPNRSETRKKTTQKRPRFRLGPRNQDSKDQEDPRTVASSKVSSDSFTRTLKYALIFQDGKLVQREVSRWPRKKTQKLTTRYKVLEPYASNYGKANKGFNCSKKFLLPKMRNMYLRPIFLLPRSIVEENKKRLLSRHMIKDHFDPVTEPFRLPMSVSLEYREQCKKYKEFQRHKYVMETIEQGV